MICSLNHKSHYYRFSRPSILVFKLHGSFKYLYSVKWGSIGTGFHTNIKTETRRVFSLSIFQALAQPKWHSLSYLGHEKVPALSQSHKSVVICVCTHICLKHTPFSSSLKCFHVSVSQIISPWTKPTPLLFFPFVLYLVLIILTKHPEATQV